MPQETQRVACGTEDEEGTTMSRAEKMPSVRIIRREKAVPTVGTLSLPVLTFPVFVLITIVCV